MRLTQRKITVGSGESLTWDPRERTLTHKKPVKVNWRKSRIEEQTVTVDETFDAAFVEHGTIHSKPSGTMALTGAALMAPLPGSAAVGAIIGGSIHDVNDTRIAYLEVEGDGFHVIVKVEPNKNQDELSKQFTKDPIVKATNIMIAIKQAAIEARKQSPAQQLLDGVRQRTPRE